MKTTKGLTKLLTTATLLVATAYCLLVLTKPISQDEGVFLTIAKYLNQGDVPYRDFFDHKPPGIYFLFAALFKIFGANVFVIKITLIVSTFGASFLVGKISEFLKRGTGWYAAMIFVFFMTQFEGYYLIAEPFMIAPLLLSLWLILRTQRSGWLVFIAGIALGLVPLFKQTGLISILPVIILAWMTLGAYRWQFFAGLVAPWLCVGAFLLGHGIIPEAWHQVVTLTLTSYPRESLGYVLRALQTNFLWTLPIWMLLLLGLGTKLSNKKILWAVILLPLPFMFFRHYPHYWIQILPFVAMISAVTLINVRSRMLTLAVLLFCVAIAGGKVGQDAIPNKHKLQEQFRVAKILRQSPATIVLAENQFTAFYFLLPQRPLNRFLYLTEITGAEYAEQKTIDDLESNQNVLILWPDPTRAYAQLVQDFVFRNSVAVQTFPKLSMRVSTYIPAPNPNTPHPSPSP